MNRFFVDLVS